MTIRTAGSRAGAAALEEPLLFRTPTPPRLPGHIALEASVPCSDPFDDHDWLFSIDWDGARALLSLDPGSPTRVQGETPVDLGRRFPDIVETVVAHDGRAAVLDGVIAVLDAQGRPDLAALGRRLAAGSALAAELPAVYLAFDVLHLDGRPVTGWALERRVEALSAFAGSGDVLQVPDHVRGRGSALAAAATARGLPALLARRARAPYRPGRRLARSPPHPACRADDVRHRRHHRAPAGRPAAHPRRAGRRAARVRGPGRRPARQGRRRWLAQHVATLDGRCRVARRGPAARRNLAPARAHRHRSSSRTRCRWCAAPPVAPRGPRRCRAALVRAPAAGRRARRRRAAGFGFAPTLIVPLPLGDTALLPRPRAMTGAVLMCRPDHFGIEYEINPWMHVAIQVDHALATGAVGSAASHLRRPRRRHRARGARGGAAGHGVHRECRCGLGRARRPGQLPPSRAAGEEPHWRAELERLRFEVHELPRSLSFEGAGDALFVGDRLFCGTGFRTDRASHRPVGRILEVEVVSLELVDPRFYHLDTCFCPLDANDSDRRAGGVLAGIRAADPSARPEPDRGARSRSPPGFACNAMPLGDQVISSLTIAQLAEPLRAAGFTVVPMAMGEFLKAGGGVRCLSLPLGVGSPNGHVLPAQRPGKLQQPLSLFPDFRAKMASCPLRSTGEPNRILVVDDERAITDLVAMALKYEGFTVQTAATAKSARHAVMDFRPDLMILDVGLPDDDGFTLVQRLITDGIKVPGDLPHRTRRHRGEGPRADDRRRRLRHEALQHRGAGRAHTRGAAPPPSRRAAR